MKQTKMIVLATSLALLSGCATKSANPEDANGEVVEVPTEVKVQQQEEQITKLNDQVELMGKNLAFLNKKVKEQEDMLKGGGSVSTQHSTVSIIDGNNRAQIDPNLVKFRAATFEVTNDTLIYNANGEQIDTWKTGMRFTSYSKAGEFYKVSGYSQRGKWGKARSAMFIHMNSTTQVR
jgi:TolA-binding protein